MRWRQQSLVWCHYIFLALGLLALGCCAKSLTQTRLYQRWAQLQMQKQSSEAFTLSLAAQHQTSASSGNLPEMSPIGQLEIPRIHMSAMVGEGTSPRVLSRAVGHATGTALPGQAGNITLAAHRDTFFRHLGDVRWGDIIELKEPGREYRYEVRFTAVVGPKDTWVAGFYQRRDADTCNLLSLPFCWTSSRPIRYSGAQDTYQLLSYSLVTTFINALAAVTSSKMKPIET